MRVPALLVVAVTLAAVTVAPAAGQDVELLGEIHGTRPPDGYYRTLAADPTAFRFAHGRPARMRQRMLELARSGAPDVPSAVLGRREAAVRGTFHIPVILGLFSDSPVGSGPYSRDAVETAYFGDGPGTVKAYYGEVSGGLVTLEGDVQDWVRSTMSQAAATGGQSGLVSGTVGPFIVSLLQQLPQDIDWGAFDNDGPDGVPNSGDDDGYVDALAVLHPTYGAECKNVEKSSTQIWSHKWSLSEAVPYAAGQAFTTATPSARGGFIKIDDYFIQPVLSCPDATGSTTLNEIGVFTHETGHAFGLPDLYDTNDDNGKTQGDGNWDLMSTGSWGCDGRSPDSPCHMGAWSKAMLGWASVTTLPDDTDQGTVALPPVESSHTVYRVNAEDGSGEYFLLENRQRLGFDRYVPGTGLLVWQIDPALVASTWSLNTVNDADHLGVRIRQADGRDDLGKSGGGRGDAGDPFPYVTQTTQNRAFHAMTNPAARSYPGSATGLTVVDIQKVGSDVSFHVSTRFTRVTVSSEGDDGLGGLFTVDGAPVAALAHTYSSAPFVPHELDAAAGESLGEGVRRPFLGWADDATAPRLRSYVTPMADATVVARYGGRQVQLAMDVTGGVDGVAPAVFVTDPASSDLWFPEGTAVKIEAQPRTGFGFLKWTGALAGQPNPATLTVNGPTQAGADFTLTYALAARTVEISAAHSEEVDLQVENANLPVAWKIVQGGLPEGLALASSGRITGSAMETGTFPVVVQATDAIGLTASATLTLVVDEPVIAVDALASTFLLVGPSLTDDQLRYLDRTGNASGTYDLGDFRAWVLAHPGLPLSAPARALLASPTVFRIGNVGTVGTGRRP